MNSQELYQLANVASRRAILAHRAGADQWAARARREAADFRALARSIARQEATERAL